ncbi:MAG TPA: NUDIX domain-containing protein [Brevundimonas sp.]|uniref:NUDIX domain-containing protein n=1 Tax=Brevundimonas sp. TaxID=1871086 RepID=UPI002DED17B1|nr:NUDIX domain-containing protein [Brevundimonas sp.]
MTPSLQFGDREPGLDYRRRPTAFGIVERDGRIACVRVDRGQESYFDLPGGAVDGEETEPEALEREFREETGMTIAAGDRFAEAGQRFRKSDGTPVDNVGGFWTATCKAHDPAAKVEDDHELVWLEPARAVAELRHDAHAWAVAKWLRNQRKLGRMER